MIDTGSDINIIQIYYLRGDLIVDETDRILIRTIGKIRKIPIEIKNNIINVNFHVIRSRFPIIKHGILVMHF